MAQSSEVMISWAAGIFEGEGCMTIGKHQRDRYHYANLVLQMSDLDVVERFAEVVGVGTTAKLASRKGKPAHHKDQFRWSLRRPDEIAWLLDQFEPYFGSRRWAKAQEIRAVLKERERTCDVCGTTYTPKIRTERGYCSDPCKRTAKRVRCQSSP